MAECTWSACCSSVIAMSSPYSSSATERSDGGSIQLPSILQQDELRLSKVPFLLSLNLKQPLQHNPNPPPQSMRNASGRENSPEETRRQPES